MSAIDDIVAERNRQIVEEGWTPGHDDHHDKGDLALAAATYAYICSLAKNEVERHESMLYGMERGTWSVVRDLWPWDAQWFKPASKRKNLIRAGALIVAEIERLDREAARDKLDRGQVARAS